MKFIAQWFNRHTPTHAGGVVYRKKEDGVEYLVVSSRNVALAWVLPKGHIEENETAEQAAIREIKEEAGVEGTIIKPLGMVSTITILLKRKVVAFYLVECSALVEENVENRKAVWLPLQEVHKKLSYRYQKKIVEAVLSKEYKMNNEK